MTDVGERVSEGSIKIRIAGRASIAAAQIEEMLVRLDATTDPRERAEILVAVAAGLVSELGDRAQAVDALLEAWRCDPSLEEILDRLEPLLRSEGRWAEALEITGALAGADRDPARAIAYAETMVRWLTREVPQPELSRHWVEQVRKLDGTHAVVHMLQAAVAREHGDHKRELDELDRAVLSAKRADERARIHLLMAARYREERTKNVALARKHLETAHRLFPTAMEPLRGLEELAIEQGDKVVLADVLRKQADAEVSDEERVAALLRLARIEEEDFRRPELAARTLERVVALASDASEALDALERCYRAARAWPELARALELGAAEALDPAVRGARLRRLGEVLESRLGDVRAAVAAYERLVSIHPDDETVLGELARLAEKSGDVARAVRCRERLAELAEEPATRARMHVIAGQLLLPTDALAARRHFERAVAADPSSQPAWTALLLDARAEGDAARVERYLAERASKTEAPRARAAAFVELAEARTTAGDAAGARRAWESACAADPTNEVAAGALVPLLVAEGREAEAEELCDAAVAGAERERDAARIFTLRRAQARIATALGRPGRALMAAKAAHESQPAAAQGKEELILAAFALRADPQVFAVREALAAIADEPDGLSVEARVSLADVLALTGDADRARVLYDETLADDPDNTRAQGGLAQQHTATGDMAGALALKRQIARAVHDPSGRFRELVLVADAAARAELPALAAEIYEEARALSPKDLPALHKLLALYQGLGRWASVFDVLRSIADADADPVRRAKTLYTMAQIAKDELADRGSALELFERALDVDPSHLVAFERIVRMLTEDKDWLGLAQMYGRMISRAEAGGDPGLQHALYEQVGLVYRDRLKDPERALAAFQAAARLRPDDEKTQAILRELLARSGQGTSAVAITLDRILRAPLDPTPYPALFDLLLAQGARDRALSVASAMRFLGVAHTAATNLRASYPQPPIEGIVMELGAEGYRELLHPGLDPALTTIFEVVAPAVVEIALARLGFRERIGHPGPELGNDWLSRLVARAAAVLGAPSPRLFLRRTPGPALGPAATRPPSLLVHPPALGGVARDVLAFIVAKRVTELTPPLLARALCPSITELKALAASAARIATDQAEPADSALRDRLGRDQVARVGAAVEAAMAGAGKLDVLTWSRFADVSASRAGLLVAGDLEAARAAIALEAQSPGDLSPREKMRELVAFCVSDSCAALRRRLGIALS